MQTWKVFAETVTKVFEGSLFYVRSISELTASQNLWFGWLKSFFVVP